MIWHPLPLRWVVYCVFTDCRMFYIINILNQHFYLATFARFYLSSTTLQYIEYSMEQDNTWVVGHAWLFWITRELHENANLWHMLNCNLFSNCSIARCGLNLVKKWDALSNNWPLMIAQTVKKLLFAVGSLLLVTQNLASLTMPAPCGVQKKVICGFSCNNNNNLILILHKIHVNMIKCASACRVTQTKSFKDICFTTI